MTNVEPDYPEKIHEAVEGGMIRKKYLFEKENMLFFQKIKGVFKTIVQSS